MLAVTLYVVVADGATTHVAAVVPAQVPPVQLKKDAGVLQLDVRVEVPPGLMDVGNALRTQKSVGGAVTVRVALAILTAPAALLPLTV